MSEMNDDYSCKVKDGGATKNKSLVKKKASSGSLSQLVRKPSGSPPRKDKLFVFGSKSSTSVQEPVRVAADLHVKWARAPEFVPGKMWTGIGECSRTTFYLFDFNCLLINKNEQGI